jgi:hypothetical protein
MWLGFHEALNCCRPGCFEKLHGINGIIKLDLSYKFDLETVQAEAKGSC